MKDGSVDLSGPLTVGGVLVAGIAALYKLFAPHVAKTLERQMMRANDADQALSERLIREEQEAQRLREQVIELVRDAADARAAEREAVAAREIVAKDVTILRMQLSAAEKELGEQRGELARARRAAGEE